MSKQLNSKRKELLINEDKLKNPTKRPAKSQQSEYLQPTTKKSNTQQKPSNKSQTIQVVQKIEQKLKQSQDRNSRSVNLNRVQSSPTKQNLSPKQQQQSLFQKKRHLMKQLEKVRIEINQFDFPKAKKSKLKTLTIIPKQNEQEIYKRVNHFLRKMQKQKDEFLLKKQLSNEKQVEKKMREDVEKYEALVAEQQKIKEQRRKSIQQKLQERKKLAQIREKINRQSNTLVQQLINSSFHHSSQKQIPYRATKRQRLFSQTSQNRSYQTETFSNPSRRTKRKYQMSPFLSQVFKEEEIRKKEEEQKIMERRQIIQRHKEYAEKLRIKSKMSTYQTLMIS